MRTKTGALAGLIVGLLLLGACDSASPTPVAPTPVQATPTRIPPTVTAVVIVPTFVVASPSPAATATPVLVATATPLPTTPIPAATPGATGGPANPGVTPTVLRQTTLPYILGTDEIEVDPALIEEVAKQMTGANKPSIHFYVSDQDVPTLKALASATFTNQGYLAVSPFTREEPVIAFFSKPNAPDLVFSTATIPANPGDLLKTMFNIQNPSSEMTQNFTAQLNGKKSLMVLISASGLLPSGPNTTPHQP